MFYSTSKNDHGLPHDPFKAIIAPRPIGWITSIGRNGEINLAPYSYFNGVSSRPPIVCFSSEGRKDSVSFVEETGEFVCNLATWDLRDAMKPIARCGYHEYAVVESVFAMVRPEVAEVPSVPA